MARSVRSGANGRIAQLPADVGFDALLAVQCKATSFEQCIATRQNPSPADPSNPQPAPKEL